MALESDYLTYAKRRYGMDHDRYPWSMLSQQQPVHWPQQNKLALWVNLAVEFFPLNQSNQPFPTPGGMTTAYPDLRHFTLRDYGNRVGLFRCLSALDNYGITPTFSVNAAVVDRYPRLLERLLARDNELLAASWHMDTLHHGDMPLDQEDELIERSLSKLRDRSGTPIKGWLSPARSQSHNTPDILAANGITYMADWINDEMPYRFNTETGTMLALPLSYELEDQFVIHHNQHSEWSYADQIKDAVDYLLAEAQHTGHGRLLALSIHPWLLGQPHRIAALEHVLAYIAEQSGIWSTSASEIARHCETSLARPTQ